MALNESMYFRYFVYSAEEEELRIKAHGPNADFGTVIVNGIPKKYTSIVASMENAKSDAIIVTKGNIKKIKYIPPKR